jgi:NADPH:quinone reductase
MMPHCAASNQKGLSMNASVMKVARAHRAGNSDELKFEDVETPQPGPGQVLIRVESASVNFSDVKRRRGDTYPFPTSFPYVPGGEVAGTIVAVGPGAEMHPIGSEVFALVGGDGQGGYAQFALAYAPQVFAIPPGVNMDRASALIIAGATAMLLLKQVGELKAGQSVAIPGASGGVGSFAVQIAKKLGASNGIALASGSDKLKHALHLGADIAINQRDLDWPEQVRKVTENKGVDLLLEANGAQSLSEGMRALAPFGRAIVYGSATGEDAQLDANTVRHWLYAPAANQAILTFNLGGWFTERGQLAGAAMGELIGMVASGVINTPKLHLIPLSEASSAHRLLENRESIGKIILKPWA